METTISRYMKHSHGEDSYNLTEEIAVRAVFRTIRPDCLADHFNTAFSELTGDVYAQARLVDIGLRFENNLALNLAAARKIRVLLDEHKILMIPAYIEGAAPEVTGIIAAAIPTIRNPDPRRYFLERWMHHEHPEVARICREALTNCPSEPVAAFKALPERPSAILTAQEGTRSNAKPTALADGIRAAQVEKRPRSRADATAKARRETPTPQRQQARSVAQAEAKPAALADRRAAEHKNLTASTHAKTASVSDEHREHSARHAPEGTAISSRTSATKKIAKASPQKSSQPRTAPHPTPRAAYRTISADEADSYGYEKLIHLIELHISDPKPEIRLKWVKLIGHIPERLDPDDEHKMRFITIGLADPVQDVILEAIAQIEFLIHDRSKLAMLLKIIDSKSSLIRSKEARTAIASLTEDSRKQLESRAKQPEKEKDSEAPRKQSVAARTDADSASIPRDVSASSRKNDEAPTAVVSESRIQPEAPKKTAEKNTMAESRIENRQSAPAPTGEPSTLIETRLGAVKADAGAAYSAEEKAELTEIVEELDLPAEAIAELERENTPSSLLIKEIVPAKQVQHSDNYFLRHSAVLHIKNIHEEAMRFELYQTVLKHDPKDLVRQIAVEEARNLKREHVRPILRLGLDDPAWQVRSDAIDYLLPLLSGTDEEGQILRDCAKDSDYHIRQKADEKLLSLSRRSAQ